jgi:hypothetical protein
LSADPVFKGSGNRIQQVAPLLVCRRLLKLANEIAVLRHKLSG